MENNKLEFKRDTSLQRIRELRKMIRKKRTNDEIQSIDSVLDLLVDDVAYYYRTIVAKDSKIKEKEVALQVHENKFKFNVGDEVFYYQVGSCIPTDVKGPYKVRAIIIRDGSIRYDTSGPISNVEEESLFHTKEEALEWRNICVREFVELQLSLAKQGKDTNMSLASLLFYLNELGLDIKFYNKENK